MAIAKPVRPVAERDNRERSEARRQGPQLACENRQHLEELSKWRSDDCPRARASALHRAVGSVLHHEPSREGARTHLVHMVEAARVTPTSARTSDSDRLDPAQTMRGGLVTDDACRSRPSRMRRPAADFKTEGSVRPFDEAQGRLGRSRKAASADRGQFSRGIPGVVIHRGRRNPCHDRDRYREPAAGSD